MSVVEWIYTLVLLLAIWNGVARELRNGLLGYLFQTALVAVLYALSAVQFQDAGIWIALVGLIVIRGIFIPWLMLKKLPRTVVNDRLAGYLLTPTYLVMVYIGVSVASLGLSEAIGKGLALPMGAGLATIAVGLSAVTLSHDAGKQVLGLMTADNGIDLCIATVLQSVSVFADYVVFLDIAVAVFLLVILMIRLKQVGSLSINDYHQLKG